MTRFEWNEPKNAANIRKHGIDFNDAIEVFNHPLLAALDERENHGEDRWIAIGWLKRWAAVVVYAERQDDVIRIISARRATKREAYKYEQIIKNELETPGPDTG